MTMRVMPFMIVLRSVDPRQHLLQVGKEPLPPVPGALIGLLLIRPEARLLHAQMGPGGRSGEGPGDDTLEAKRGPGVSQRLVRLDGKDPAVGRAPVATQSEAVVDDGL